MEKGREEEQDEGRRSRMKGGGKGQREGKGRREWGKADTSCNNPECNMQCARVSQVNNPSHCHNVHLRWRHHPG